MKFLNFFKITVLIIIIETTIEMKLEGSEIITNQNFIYKNSTRFLDNKTSDHLNIEYRQLFKFFWNKVFICVTLLYFHALHLILFTNSFILKLALSYYDTYAYCKLSDLIPIKVFQIIGIASYFLFAFNIIYNLMFYEGKIESNDLNNKKKSEDRESIKFIFNLKTINIDLMKAIIKISGLIIVSHILDGQNSNSYRIESVLELNNNKLIIFGFDALANLLSIISAMFIGYFLSKQMNINANLIFSSITFLLMGIDISLKYFSSY